MLYPLSKIQQQKIDDTWKFLDYFTNKSANNFKKIKASEYRLHIIHKVNIYTIQQFYEYEKIINILYWNLKKKLKKYYLDNKTKYLIKKNLNDPEINNIYYNKYIKGIKKPRSNEYMSFVNSVIHFNDINKKWYITGRLSELDDICMNIMRDKKIYYVVYNKPSYINKKYIKDHINLYFNLNYPFPNVNPMFFNRNRKSRWINRITKMYYNKNKKIDKYWYKIIY